MMIYTLHVYSKRKVPPEIPASCVLTPLTLLYTSPYTTSLDFLCIQYINVVYVLF